MPHRPDDPTARPKAVVTVPGFPEPDLPPPALPYRADTFTLGLYEGWQEGTAYTLAGPVEDDQAHPLTVSVDPEAGAASVEDYAAWHLRVQQDALRACHLLHKGPVRLANGLPAFQATVAWYPVDDRCLYQEQLIVLHEGIGYRLTATFTKTTRVTLGPRVEQAMRAFQPRTGRTA
jgi:hypothetical protein